MANTPVYAWTGTGNDNHPNVQVGGGKVVTLKDQYSNHAPAIAHSNGLYYLAWTGTDQNLNITSSSDGGITWSTVSTFEQQFSNNGPTLAVAPDGSLYLGWTGTNGKLNSMVLTSSGWSSTPVTISQTSEYAYDLIVI